MTSGAATLHPPVRPLRRGQQLTVARSRRSPGEAPGGRVAEVACRWCDGRPVVSLWIAVFVAAFGTNVPTPLLLIYRDELGLSSNALTGAFGDLRRGLGAGPAAGRTGLGPVRAARRRAAVRAAVDGHLAAVPGRRVRRCCCCSCCRFLQGAVSGVVFSVGTAWLAELIGEPARSARLTTAALGGGWALGPADLRAARPVGTGPDRAALPGARGAHRWSAWCCCPRSRRRWPPADRRAGALINLGVPAGPGARSGWSCCRSRSGCSPSRPPR